MLKKFYLVGAVLGLDLIQSKYNWPLVVQLVRDDSSKMQCVCLSQGVLYNANYNNVIVKSINSLDW